MFEEGMVAVHMNKLVIEYNKPLYLGMVILDGSKTLMYRFHYDYIKPKYGDKANLLLTDTDFLCYHITTEDYYKDTVADVEEFFGTSDYETEHPAVAEHGYKVGCNKKVIGKMKNEYLNDKITEFVGLRSKLYSLITCNNISKRKCKGFAAAARKKSLSHEHFLTCLFTGKPQMREMHTLRTYKHEIFGQKINKVDLSADDDKLVILPDGISKLAYGHYRLQTV
jgi:hypothetical protein